MRLAGPSRVPPAAREGARLDLGVGLRLDRLAGVVDLGRVGGRGVVADLFTSVFDFFEAGR
uniref:hypothetical protein n=1 Tax=Kitasatospora sp. NBC_01519 TaxID=2903576 RepID=UPI002F91421F